MTTLCLPFSLRGRDLEACLGCCFVFEVRTGFILDETWAMSSLTLDVDPLAFIFFIVLLGAVVFLVSSPKLGCY